MNLKQYLFILLAIPFFSASCKSSKESISSTGVWVNREKLKDKSYHSVFIVVVTADVQARLQVESDLAAVATNRGYKAVKSIDLLPVDLKNPKVPTKEQVIAKVEESGCDAVFVASLLQKREDAYYTPGQTSYSVQPYATYYPGYYSHWSPAVSEPGYFTHEKNYFMQSNLFDAASQEIMWSVQSTIFSPEDLKGFSKSYTSTLLKQLEKEKVLKK